jgi:cell division protease FtsH
MKKRSRTDKLADWWRGVLGFVARNPLMVGLALAFCLLVALFFIGISLLAPHSPGQPVDFSTAQQDVATRGRVIHATMLDQDAREQLQLRDGTNVWTAYPAANPYTAQILQNLLRHRVPTTIEPQSWKPALRLVVQFLLPILILATLFALFALMSRESGGAIAGFSKWAGRKQKAREGSHGFRDVAGAPEALTELREFVDYLDNPMKYANLGARAPKGVLLIGPPGTGKTLLARAVAGEAAANFFSMSGSEFVESLVGVGAARVRDLFRQAREAAPCIVFIDELDAVGRQRGAGMGQGHDEREQTLNQMLVEMDGFGAESGVVVMAATNRPDILDGALLRPGRFDRQVVVDLPDVHGRTEILGLYASRSPMSPSANLGSIAHQTPGMSGADLANVINEASLLAVRAGKEMIEQPELEEAIDRVLMGPARKSHLLTPEELWRIAVHESGHAIVAKAIQLETALQKLSVIARGRGRGGITVFASGDHALLTQLDLTKQLIAQLGGAAAESYVFGMVSTGVEDDLDRATKIAHSMVAAYGMSPAVGLVTIGEREEQVFIGRDLANMGNVAPAALELVDSETRRLVHEAEETAKRLLALNADVLQDLANSLVRSETLSGPALDVYMDGVKLWREPLIKHLDAHETTVRHVRDGEDDGGLIWDDEVR